MNWIGRNGGIRVESRNADRRLIGLNGAALIAECCGCLRSSVSRQWRSNAVGKRDVLLQLDENRQAQMWRMDFQTSACFCFDCSPR